jgi:hypothetical protein
MTSILLTFALIDFGSRRTNRAFSVAGGRISTKPDPSAPPVFEPALHSPVTHPLGFQFPRSDSAVNSRRIPGTSSLRKRMRSKRGIVDRSKANSRSGVRIRVRVRVDGIAIGIGIETVDHESSPSQPPARA